MSRTFSGDEIKKLSELITEGVHVLTEIDTLKGGLKDTVIAVAEELDVAPAVLNKAIRTAYKVDLDEKRKDIDIIEDILTAVGRSF